MTDTLDVLVIADDGDLHYLAVERALHLRGAQVKAWNLSTFRSTSMTFDGDRLLLEFPDGSSAIVDSTTTVWWRRVGRTPTEDLSTEEAALVRDENPHALIGCLDALGARWVDHPDVVARAERKLFQLAAMRANGIRTPRFVVTNSIEAAREFHKHDPVVTKALSPGEGIAPFTDRVTSHDIDQYIACNPTLLQEDVNALADLRVVVVGSTVMVWRRPRGDTTVDWRADDPEGTGFLLADEASFGARRLANLRDQALAANALLGLSVSVQDWLVTGVEVSVVIRLFGSKDSTALNRLLRRGGAPSTRLRFETWEKEDGQVAR